MQVIDALFGEGVSATFQGIGANESTNGAAIEGHDEVREVESKQK